MDQSIVRRSQSGNSLETPMVSDPLRYNFPMRYLFILAAIVIPTGLYIQQTVKVNNLSEQLKTDGQSKVALAQKQAALDAEIARKKELAVLYERAEAARKQAVSDLNRALTELSQVKKTAPVPKKQTGK